MSHRAVCVALVLLLALAAPAVAADRTYEEGETVALSVGTLPQGYETYWVSDVDGYLAQGSTLREDGLSLGEHTLYALIYRTSDWAHVWTGSLSVEIVTVQAAAPTAPTASAGEVAPGEFEAVSEVLLGCPDAYSVDDMYPEILDGLRGVASTRIFVDNSYVRYDLLDLFRRTGVDDADYSFETMSLDSIWIRDYGPLFVRKSGTLEVVDLEYYSNRPNDNDVPRVFAQSEGYARRAVDLEWEGGNYTSDGQGGVYATDVLYDYNTYYYSQAQIGQLVQSAFAGTLNVFDHMLNDGGTGHIDMFLVLTGSRSALVNRFPSGHQNYSRMERHTDRLRGMGFSVARLDLADSGYSSYTNGILVNGTALVPTYANASRDAAALDVYRQAGYRPVGIDCR
ncbi:agmatine deiminase family protein, partial [Planctomycetota bacterium]